MFIFNKIGPLIDFNIFTFHAYDYKFAFNMKRVRGIWSILMVIPGYVKFISYL